MVYLCRCTIYILILFKHSLPKWFSSGVHALLDMSNLVSEECKPLVDILSRTFGS